MKQFIPSLTLTTSIILFAFAGCSKPSSETTDTAGNAQPARPQRTVAAPAKIERSTQPALNRTRKEVPSAPNPSTHESDYRSTTDEDVKLEIISNLGDVGTREAVEAMGRLFQAEKDSDLKVEMLSELSFVDGFDTEKLAIYRLGVKADQPLEVRTEAIDGLGDIEDVRVIPILQELTKDKNSEVSDAARNALEIVQSAVLTK
ncbi:MAG: HEAT repeat domain-containing protein [Verrucomicrobiae bacterium]|nr:HEAT repeat domain-containing protein [Verrucomicrobiae bacterium]